MRLPPFLLYCRRAFCRAFYPVMPCIFARGALVLFVGRSGVAWKERL